MKPNIVERKARSRGSCLLAGMLLLLGGGSAPLSAQDRAILQPSGNSASRIILRGTVEDYTGKQLRIRLNNGQPPRAYPAEAVIKVETQQTREHQRGQQLFDERKIAEAATELEAALVREDRAWVRRDILALLVRCALHDGQYVRAGSRFLALIQSDRTTRHFSLIPLAWAPIELTAELRSEAETWLRSEEPVARLMGASFLVVDPQRREAAEGALNLLCSNPDRRVRELAQAQVLRLKLQKTELNRLELERWQVRIEEMPEDLRGGPYYVLGRAHLARRELERSAALMLWVPLVYDHDRHFAARACLEAARSLGVIGQQEAAAALYVELTDRFAGTPSAREAQALLLLDEPPPDRTN